MRNNLATQVLEWDMLYLMKSYQATVQEPERLSATAKLLENTSVLIEFCIDTNRPVRYKDPRLTGIQKTLNFFNEWKSSSINPRHLLTKECRYDLNSSITGFISLCNNVLRNGEEIKPGYFNSNIFVNFFCQQGGIKHGCNTNPTVRKLSKK